MAGKRLKDSGRLAGIPDLFLAHVKGYDGGMFIEMKSEEGKLSKEQKEMHLKLSCSYKVVTCHSFDKFKKAVTDYIEN